jgi:hypothetical protein
MQLSPSNPQEPRMEKFIERQNITNYLDQLKTETDPTRRDMLQKLLAEESVKQASHTKDKS